jgi:hypothetical protein
MTSTDESIDPYLQGFRASADVRPDSANPYRPGTAAHEEWAKGHFDGEEDWAKLCESEVREGRPRPQS